MLSATKLTVTCIIANRDQRNKNLKNNNYIAIGDDMGIK